MNKQISAAFYSLTLLSCALGLMWLGHYMSELSEQDLKVRNIAIALSPPPPPPPKSQQTLQETDITLQVKGAGAEVVMADMRIVPNVQTSQPTMPQLALQKPRWEMPQIDIEAYGLGELDAKPTLLTPVKIRFPKRLKNQGVSRVVIKLDVMIDEDGNVNLMDIIENPYHELNKEILRFVKGSKFTSPFKENEAVKARFIWPLVIEA